MRMISVDKLQDFIQSQRQFHNDFEESDRKDDKYYKGYYKGAIDNLSKLEDFLLKIKQYNYFPIC